MAELAYQDFDLHLGRGPGGFRATVRESPAGAASVDFALPFDPVKLENYLLRLGRVRRGVRRIESPESAAAREFGGALFEAVFTNELRACLRSSLDEVARRRRGLRIRLHIEDPSLASLPWEYLYYASRSQFLALSVHSPLVRYLELPEPVPVLAVDPPLRVLVMISAPKDYPSLDTEREWRVLTQALGTLNPARRVVCDRMDDATLHALQRRLRRRQYHVFHFIGHGGYDRTQDEGVLMLEDEEHRGQPVSSRTLGLLLHDHRPLRLAVLNACEGARSSVIDPFAGSAQTLVQLGLPAVIAMQFEIGDEVAATFAQELYGALSDGYPVDAAITESRKALFAAGHDIEWGTPVLYMRSPDGRIFQLGTTAVPTLAPTTAASRPAAGPRPGGGAGTALAREREEPNDRDRQRPPVVDAPAPPPADAAPPIAALLDEAREASSSDRHAEALQLVADALTREPDSSDALSLKRDVLHAMRDWDPRAPARAPRWRMSWRHLAIGAAVVATIGLAVDLALWMMSRPVVDDTSTPTQQAPPPATTPEAPTPVAQPVDAGTAVPPASEPERGRDGADRAAATAPAGSRATRAKPGRLVFDVPPGVEVSVDGTLVGRAPVKPIEMRAGTHEVRLWRSDLGELRRAVKLEPGAGQTIAASESTMREWYSDAQSRLARRALSLGNPEQAVTIVSDALAINATHATLSQILAELHKEARRDAHAARGRAEDAGRSIRRSPLFQTGDVQLEQAEASTRAGRLEQAIRGYWSARQQFDQAASTAKP